MKDLRSLGTSYVFSFVISGVAALAVCAMAPTKAVRVAPIGRALPQAFTASSNQQLGAVGTASNQFSTTATA
jgi:hypothetical protein